MNQGLDAIRRVAERLGPIADRVVFLGGATVPLLVTDPAAAEPRPTKDVDVAIDVKSRAAYSGRLRSELHARGFVEDTSEGAPIGRWIVDDLRVDIMPADGSVLGFSNRWYGPALATKVSHVLPGGSRVWVASGPCFLATKLDAFADRGEGDFSASHDLEDFIAVVDGRPAIETELRDADPQVRDHLRREVGRLLDSAAFVAALAGLLPPDTGSQARLPALRARLLRMAGRLPDVSAH
ncbi:MAG TPA: hypothetical protein VFY71_17405 [Planctomycetota bacterium]|nr:hypothetical protein [Planctomycetota bacterium]